MRTAEAGDFRAEVTDDRAAWFRRAIHKSGQRLTWKPCGSGRWDERHGFWGGTPHGSEPHTSALAAIIREQ